MSGKLIDFIRKISSLVEQGQQSEERLLQFAKTYMEALVASDDWLPPEMAVADSQRYQQYLLYGDPFDRFSVVSFVWAPGQATPVHDHTVWGVIGILRGSEQETPFKITEAGAVRPAGPPVVHRPGQVACVGPKTGDLHEVRNASAHEVAISIHLYGGNIGRINRHVYAADSGQVKSFVSGYSNRLCPNLWMGVDA